MSYITDNVAKHVKDKGINLSNMARQTKIPYSSLYSSIGESGRNRNLRDDELIAVCRFLNISPMDFVDTDRR